MVRTVTTNDGLTATVKREASPGVPAHIQHTTLRIEEYVPYHPTRTDDPYYRIFNEQKRRMQKLGLLVCAVCKTEDNIEIHHNEVEFSMSQGVDISKFSELHPDLNIKDDATFQEFVEGEHNLTPLCLLHHRGARGIHVLPYPWWQLEGVWKDTLPDGPAKALQGEDALKIAKDSLQLAEDSVQAVSNVVSPSASTA